MQKLLHAVEKAQVGQHTNFAKPFEQFQEFIRQRGLVIVISDFYADPEQVIQTILPLRFKKNEVVLFHLLDRQELEPSLAAPATMIDMESGEAIEVTPEYLRGTYRERVNTHIEALRSKAQGAGMDYFLMPTDKPLDAGLREYLAARQGRM
jgi:hypothetical protein